jgi:hypothetical protein
MRQNEVGLTYVATVSTTKRIVGVRSTDEHLFIVDPGKHSDVILTIILFVRPKRVWSGVRDKGGKKREQRIS